MNTKTIFTLQCNWLGAGEPDTLLSSKILIINNLDFHKYSLYYAGLPKLKAFLFSFLKENILFSRSEKSHYFTAAKCDKFLNYAQNLLNNSKFLLETIDNFYKIEAYCYEIFSTTISFELTQINDTDMLEI